MGRAVARQAFELQGNLDQPLDLGITVTLGDEFGDTLVALAILVLADPQRARQRPWVGRVAGHQFAQPVGLAVRDLQDAADVLQHGARLHFSKGDDLRHLVTAIALLDVIDHLDTPGFAKIDIEIGHGHTVGIEETFEQQPMFERIEIGDRQRPGDNRAGPRAATRPHRNALRFCPADEIRHDEEIAGKAHGIDDAKLERQPRVIRRGGIASDRVCRQSRGKAGFGGGDQRRVFGCAAIRHSRQDRLARWRGDGAALRHHQRVGERFGQIGKGLAHFAGRFQPVLRIGLAPFLGLHIGRIGDAQQRIMGDMDTVIEELDRIGGDDRQVQAFGQPQQAGFGTHLDRVSAARNLDIQPAGEVVDQRGGIIAGRLAIGKQPCQRAIGAAGQAQQPRCAALEIGKQQMRLLIRFDAEVRLADQRDQIAITGRVLGKQHQPIVNRPCREGACSRPFDGDHGADDRLNASILGGGGKIHRREHVAAIGQARCRQPLPPTGLGEIFWLNRAFEHRIRRLQAKMHEAGVGRG